MKPATIQAAWEELISFFFNLFFMLSLLCKTQNLAIFRLPDYFAVVSIMVSYYSCAHIEFTNTFPC